MSNIPSMRESFGPGALRNRKKPAFTLVELIVVITILAVLATIGFLALSGYSQDAKDSAIRMNVRSVFAAISSESVLTGNSPRYYVIHDSGAALSWAVAYVDGSPVTLTWGDWNVVGTNYSAGNPDYAKLKMNPEKFKVSALPNLPFVTVSAAAPYDSKYLSVGAMEAAINGGTNGKKRVVSYFQVAAVVPTTGAAAVFWNYPAAPGSVPGLVRDFKSSSSTGAMVDGTNSSAAPTPCPAVTKSVNGRSYAVPSLAVGASSTVTTVQSVVGGSRTYSQSFLCSSGEASPNGSETFVSISCPAAGFAAVGDSCLPDSCLSIKNADASSANGQYSIDPDGIWTNAAFGVYCDMAGGGWTQVLGPENPTTIAGVSLVWSYAGTVVNTPSSIGLATNVACDVGNQGVQVSSVKWIPHSNVRVDSVIWTWSGSVQSGSDYCTTVGTEWVLHSSASMTRSIAGQDVTNSTSWGVSGSATGLSFICSCSSPNSQRGSVTSWRIYVK